MHSTVTRQSTARFVVAVLVALPKVWYFVAMKYLLGNGRNMFCIVCIFLGKIGSSYVLGNANVSFGRASAVDRGDRGRTLEWGGSGRACNFPAPLCCFIERAFACCGVVVLVSGSFVWFA